MSRTKELEALEKLGRGQRYSAFRNDADPDLRHPLAEFLHDLNHEEDRDRPERIDSMLAGVLASRMLIGTEMMHAAADRRKQDRDASEQLGELAQEVTASTDNGAQDDGSPTKPRILEVKRLPVASITSLSVASSLLGVVIASVLQVKLGPFVAAYLGIASAGLGASTIGFLMILNRKSRYGSTSTKI